MCPFHLGPHFSRPLETFLSYSSKTLKGYSERLIHSGARQSRFLLRQSSPAYFRVSCHLTERGDAVCADITIASPLF